MLPASLASLRNYVDGEFVSTERQFDNISPLHGRLLGRVHEADAALVDRAVQAARKALEGPWGRSTVDERAAWLHKVADVIERRFDEFVAAEVADTGRPVTQARNLDVFRAIANLRTFADLGKVAHGECFESRTAQGEALLNYTVRKPLGVVATHLALEPAHPVDDLEGGPRPDLRQHPGRQTVRGDPFFGHLAGRGLRRSRCAPRRVQPGAWLWCQLGRVRHVGPPGH